MSHVQDLTDIRIDYSQKPLNRIDLADNPIDQFKTWFDEVIRAEVPEPNAMTLASANKEGIPSARIVLLKGLINGSFIMYTNYTSHKAKEILENPNVALVFHWKDLHRQVRIQGTVSKLDDQSSEKYFKSRPRGSQISAWASPQSQIVNDRGLLERERLNVERRFQDQPVLPKPPFWGGFSVKPSRIEFWQGRVNRFHDRFVYNLLEDGNWQIDRLAP